MSETDILEIKGLIEAGFLKSRKGQDFGNMSQEAINKILTTGRTNRDIAEKNKAGSTPPGPPSSNSSSSSSSSSSAASASSSASSSGGDMAKKMMELCFSVAMATAGLTPNVVLDHAKFYIDQNGPQKGAVLISASLAAVGNVKKNFGVTLESVMIYLGPVPNSFRSGNGPNFKGFTMLGYMIMIGLGMMDEDEIMMMGKNLRETYNNFVAKVGSSDIREYKSNPGLSDKDDVKNQILLQAKELFTRSPPDKGDCLRLAKAILMSSAGTGVVAVNTLDVVPKYTPDTDGASTNGANRGRKRG